MDWLFLWGSTLTSSDRFKTQELRAAFLGPMYCVSTADHRLKRIPASLAELKDCSPRNGGFVSKETTRTGRESMMGKSQATAARQASGVPSIVSAYCRRRQ